MAYMTIDADIEVYNFWDECSNTEREELRDLVVEEFNIDTESSPKTALDHLMTLLGEGADTEEAKDFVRKVATEVEYRLKMRDFSQLIVK